MTERLEPVPWTADMSVGVESIDLEHSMLVTLYNDLVHALNRPVSATTKRRYLDSVRSHLLTHLAHEEAVLRSRGHPEIDAHVSDHRHGKAALAALTDRPEEQVDLVEIARFLRDWIIRHIMVDDREAFAALPPDAAA